MTRATKRSKAERALYPHDNTKSRETDNVKVLSLEPPDRIKDHPVKLNYWNFICADLASRQLLSPGYHESIVILVDNITNYEEYIVMLEETGALVPVFDSRTGEKIVGYKENPLFSMVKQLEKMINKLCENFGLNPKHATYTANPDIKEKAIEHKPSESSRKGITYFQ